MRELKLREKFFPKQKKCMAQGGITTPHRERAKESYNFIPSKVILARFNDDERHRESLGGAYARLRGLGA
jgi:hypothetical protein